MRLLVIAHGGVDDHVCARGLELRREDQPVGLVDLPWAQNLSGAPELASRGHDGGARAAHAEHFGDPGRRQRSKPRGRERRSGLGDDLAGTDVAAPRPNVIPGVGTALNFDVVVIVDNILDGDDSICAVRDDAAGGDSHRLPRLERAGGGSSGRNPLHDGQATRRVDRTNRKAVHRRARERRQVDGGAGALCEHAASGGFDRNRLRRQGSSMGEDQLLRLADRQETRHGPHKLAAWQTNWWRAATGSTRSSGAGACPKSGSPTTPSSAVASH